MGSQHLKGTRFLGVAAVQTQYAALCWRPAEAGHEILLITSRDTGRWIIPKGWPIRGLAPEAVAAQEAWEEAGVKGEVSSVQVGRYGYFKIFEPATQIACAVVVYDLQVRHLTPSFPEAGERQLAWLCPRQAAERVAEPDLASLITRYAPPRRPVRHAPITGDI